MEQDLIRKQIFNQMTKVQHRIYGPMVNQFLSLMNDDPYFTGRALVHIFKTSKIRDQQDCAIIVLLQSSPEYGFRDAGSALFALDFAKTKNSQGMKSLPPYRLFRIWDYIHGNEVILDNGKQKRIKRQTPGPKVYSRMKNLMTRYINFLDADIGRFDGVSELNKSELKYVYTTYGLRPSERAQAILFDNDPPADSKAGIIKEVAKLAESGKVVDAAIKGIENNISYIVLQSIVPKSEPAVAIAMVEAMTSQQAANSIGWVEKSGILQIDEVKQVFTDKVSKAKSIASLEHRKSSRATDVDVIQAVEIAKEKEASKLKKIERETLILIDISSSMGIAIEPTLKMVSHLAPYLDLNKTRLIWFKQYAGEVKPRTFGFQDLKNSVRGLRADGGTSHVAGLQKGLENGFEPQNLVIVTDGQENGHARMLGVGEVAHATSRLSIVPQVTILGLGQYYRGFTQSFEDRGVPVDEFIFDDSEEYYIYDQIGALLGGDRKKTLTEMILDIELPYIEKFLV